MVNRAHSSYDTIYSVLFLDNAAIGQYWLQSDLTTGKYVLFKNVATHGFLVLPC